jgi:hypothetical protein
MTWHTTTVPAEQLASAVADIGDAGGTITNCCPGEDSVRIVWTTAR